MKIVIGVDDSPHSVAALEWVKRMTWPKDSEWILVAAAETLSFVFVDPAGAGLHEQLQRDQVEHCRRTVADAEARLRPAGVRVTSRVEIGDPRDALVRIAEAEKADLMVVGSHGRTGVPRLLLGSVAGYVTSHAPCSVVVVKRPRETR